MKKMIFLILIVSGIFMGFSLIGDTPGAKDIVTHAENKIKGLSSVSEMTVQIVRSSWTRSMTVKSWARGEDYSISVVTAPAKDAGTVFLKRQKEIWNWVPSVERAVKLPPSMMAQSWMGTDFTNDDLVKASSRINDYTHSLKGDSIISGRKCWKIEMIPLPNAAVVWGKVNMWVDQKDTLELCLKFYDEDSVLVNTLVCSDIKSMGGRTIPCKMEMIPAGKKGQETIITYNSMAFNQKLDDDMFTTDNMKKIK